MKTNRTTIELPEADNATIDGYSFICGGVELVAHRAYTDSTADTWQVTDPATARRVVHAAKTKTAAIAAALSAAR